MGPSRSAPNQLDGVNYVEGWLHGVIQGREVGARRSAEGGGVAFILMHDRIVFPRELWHLYEGNTDHISHRMFATRGVMSMQRAPKKTGSPPTGCETPPRMTTKYIEVCIEMSCSSLQCCCFFLSTLPDNEETGNVQATLLAARCQGHKYGRVSERQRGSLPSPEQAQTITVIDSRYRWIGLHFTLPFPVYICDNIRLPVSLPFLSYTLMPRTHVVVRHVHVRKIHLFPGTSTFDDGASCTDFSVHDPFLPPRLLSGVPRAG